MRIKYIYKVIVMLIVVFVFGVALTSCSGSLSNQLNKIEIQDTDGIIQIKTDDKEKFLEIKREYDDGFKSGDYEKCIETLNNTDAKHIALLAVSRHLWNSSDDGEQPDITGYDISLFYDEIATMGWEKLTWDNEMYGELVHYLYANNDDYYDCPEISRVYYICDDEEFSKLPEPMQLAMKLTEEEFQVYVSGEKSRIEDIAIDNAKKVLTLQLKDPNSLQIISESAEYLENGKVNVRIRYSATNSFGGRVSNTYTFTDKGQYGKESFDEIKEKVVLE